LQHARVKIAKGGGVGNPICFLVKKKKNPKLSKKINGFGVCLLFGYCYYYLLDTGFFWHLKKKKIFFCF
jgi:hypothetical protein